jgi:hypothetical protein
MSKISRRSGEKPVSEWERKSIETFMLNLKLKWIAVEEYCDVIYNVPFKKSCATFCIMNRWD